MNEFDSIAERLAEDLRTGVYPPGFWLRQIELQERYGAGRASVRRALETLAGRRLIWHRPNHGFFVYPEDSEDTLRILDLRIALETGFAQAMCAGATSEMRARLRHLADTFASLAAVENLARLYEINLEFHRTLLACANNEHLIALVDELRSRTSPAPAAQWCSGRARIASSAEEHRQMVAALDDGKPDELAQLIRQHIRP